MSGNKKTLWSLCLLCALCVSKVAANTLDSLLADNRLRAGVRAAELFAPLDSHGNFDLDSNQLLDYKFLLANLPLADLALMTREDLLENVNLAAETLNRFPWAAELSPEMYLHYVLPHRVSQEPYVHWRKQFLEEIGPRVEELSIKEAILEVNHWCHEKATYRPTDGRDQDPLTTIRSGFGRCEEEMILTICALRSVGIPARQCYTPYWAHSDDNHAWVEAWGGDGWYYLGACEPAQELNQAWFSGPAQRAMLVVSTAYGDYGKEEKGKRKEEIEPVLRRYGRSTLINSTTVYGPTKELTVTVVDKKNKPVPNCKVIFSLWNYGTLMPAMSVMTDQQGVAKLVCGKGDWFVSAQTPTEKDDPFEDDALFWVTGIPKAVRKAIAGFFTGKPEPMMAFAHVKGADTLATLKLDSKTPEGWVTELEYTPPPAPETKAPDVISAEGVARGVTDNRVGRAAEPDKATADSLFGARLAWEDSVREANVWGCDTTGWGGLPEYAEYFRKARGNWINIYKHKVGKFPNDTSNSWKITANGSDDIDRRSFTTYFDRLADKDLRDWNWPWGSLSEAVYNLILISDSTGGTKCLHNPRIDYEPTIGWRWQLIEFLVGPILDGPRSPSCWSESRDPFYPYISINEKGHPELITSEKKLLSWLRTSITLEPTTDRLGPPLTPAQCLELRRGTASDIERLYIGLCRVRGIPARRNPVTNVVERWEVGSMEDGKRKMEPEWVSVEVLQSPKPKAQSPNTKGKLTISLDDQSNIQNLKSKIYGKDWALSKWEGDHTEVMDLGWTKPFEELSWPQELPVGWYLLSSGIRREDGSAPVRLQWIEVKGGGEIRNYELRITNGM